MNALGLSGTDDIDAWLSDDGWYRIIAASNLYLLTRICCKQLAHERKNAETKCLQYIIGQPVEERVCSSVYNHILLKNVELVL